MSLKFSSITFLWPSLLWLLLILPVLLGLYWLAESRRRGAHQAYPALETVGQRDDAWAGVRRHLPVALMFLALTAMLLSIARPQAVLALPSRVETVILALDMSGSMRAADVKPSRFVAAQNAAKAFVADQPRHVRVGVVAVAGTAAVVQSPTHNREDITQSIDRLQPQRGTALGSGLIISLSTLLPDARIDVEKLVGGGGPPGAKPRPSANARPGANGSRGDAAGKGDGTGKADKSGADGSTPVAPGSNGSAVIILLTDGQSNTGPEVTTAIDVANEYGVRVYTVGVGTTEGATVTADGWSMRVKLDEDGLRKIASSTGAEYFRATNAGELKKIYRYVSAKLALEKQSTTEVTALFVGLGTLFALLAAFLSMIWFNRIL